MFQALLKKALSKQILTVLIICYVTVKSKRPTENVSR